MGDFNKKTLLVFIGASALVLFWGVGLAFANSAQDFSEAKQLVGSQVGCEQLNESQLELIGEYYMEQMHPGEQHELMDEMIGGEGSEQLRQMHAQMARRIYCGQESFGMMGMMGAQGMMGSGMRMGAGTMNYGLTGYGLGWSVFDILYLVLLVGLVVLVFLWIIKLSREVFGGKK